MKNIPSAMSKISASFHQQRLCLNKLFAYLIILVMLFSACGRKHDDSNGNSKLDPRTEALLFLKKNQLNEAEASFIKAIETGPDNVLNNKDLTLLYLLQKNYKSAENQAKAGLKIKPEDLDLRLMLAEISAEKGDKNGAIQELKEVLKKDAKNVKALYKLAGLGSSGTDQTWKKNYLTQVSGLVPANIVPRLELAELLAANNQTDSAIFNLGTVKKIVPEFFGATKVSYQKALSLLQANHPAAALPFMQTFHKLMQLSAEYASGNDELKMPQLIAGHVAFSASQEDQVSYDTKGKGILNAMTFTDASELAGLALGKGLNSENSVLAKADRDGVGNLYVYAGFTPAGSSSAKHYLMISKTGAFEACNVIGGIDHEGQDLDATFADYDNDGFQDLFIATTKGIIVYRNQGDGTFTKVTKDIGLGKTANANKMLFADFDQDGDLDILVGQKGGNKFFRNNGDGTFTEQANTMGLSGNPQGTIAMDFGDWDGDGDVDIVGLNENGGVQLFNNNRHSNFKDISDSVGLRNAAYSGSAIAFADYNNDGMLDIFMAGGPGGKCSLLKNDGHRFSADLASKKISNALKGIKVNDVAFVDFDNDGHQDLLVAGESADKSKSGVKLFHNDTTKGFSDVSYLLPKNVMRAHHIKIGDFDMDGDQDILLSGPDGVQFLRNDGGNMNHYMQVQLFGLSYGNSKNNRLGVGAQVELRSGDLYQLKTVTGPITEFGVGRRNKFGTVRVIWPNGVAQTIADPTSQERILEVELLKGSCPFLFTWNGEKYEFIKDMMWRSALGMPLAIHGKDTTYAFSDASKEYLLIPGEKLKPRDGRYSIKVTEELWEAVYFDKVGLTAVDHPDSIDVYADERFVPPPFPGKKVYQVADKHLPVSAKDEKGNDLLAKISTYDFQYAANFSPGKFQGIAENHELILDLGSKAKADSLTLFLRGWIFPSDASINMAVAQSDKYSVHPPSLQVINKKGEWQTVIPNMGFPMGRDKMVIANLSGKFLTANDRRVRISTNMQIYWDQIFFSARNVKAPVKMQDLSMIAANLDFRGYSADYRKGGPFGPEWFDYSPVSKGQKWRDLTGNYTRYGDVLPLLQKSDDEYIIADGGDEISIDFDAAKLPALPKGWKRDFLIYSDGWVKDGDLNTANGQTVAPLPFHKMPSYPYGRNVAYPADKAHREYQQKYNTRKVSTFDFKNALKTASVKTATKTED
ncbi:MAG: FG-GAP-like repeat-containing protein [Sphingobacteriales bacterium]